MRAGWGCGGRTGPIPAGRRRRRSGEGWAINELTRELAGAGRIDSVETWSGKDRGDENFPVGSALIRAELRPHVHAYYAFARNADDIGDSPVLAPQDKIDRLDVMEAVLLGRRDDGSASALRLRASLAETGVSVRHATDLLVAFRQDAVKPRYATWEELLGYCRYSAMPVGRYLLDLHGEKKAAWEGSDALCASLQVLNHLQDCANDLAVLDRCYLPLDALAAQGAVVDDLARPALTAPMRRVMDALLARCAALNATARRLMPACRDRRMRLESAVIVGLAERLTRRLGAEDALAGRVKLSRLDMVASVLGALRWL